jgi:hypothetical protein
MPNNYAQNSLISTQREPKLTSGTSMNLMTNPTIVGYTQTFSASASSFFSSPAGGGEEATGWGTPSSLFSASFPTPTPAAGGEEAAGWVTPAASGEEAKT